MMSGKRIFALLCILAAATTGWFILGSAAQQRSHAMNYSLGGHVSELWGRPMTQQPAQFSTALPGSDSQRSMLAAKNEINVRLELEQRRKGLIWYPTYRVDFKGRYLLKNAEPVAKTIRLFFPLPAADATYDNFTAQLGGKPLSLRQDENPGVYELVQLAAGEQQWLELAYRSRGMGHWQYQPTGEQRRVKNLDMTITTNFQNVDFLEGGLSPMTKTTTDEGMALSWQATDLLTSQAIGVAMPERINPGPLASRISFFAPVGLIFFFVLVTALALLHKIEIHPMHYLFVTGGFFAFHLLFAYLVDVVNVHLAFLLAALVAVGLINSYLRAALSQSWPWKQAALGLLFYLVMFSYSFFLNGITGLAITIGSIATLGLLMLLTAKINWGEAFASAANRSDERAAEKAARNLARSAARSTARKVAQGKPAKIPSDLPVRPDAS